MSFFTYPNQVSAPDGAQADLLAGVYSFTEMVGLHSSRVRLKRVASSQAQVLRTPPSQSKFLDTSRIPPRETWRSRAAQSPQMGSYTRHWLACELPWRQGTDHARSSTLVSYQSVNPILEIRSKTEACKELPVLKSTQSRTDHSAQPRTPVGSGRGRPVASKLVSGNFGWYRTGRAGFIIGSRFLRWKCGLPSPKAKGISISPGGCPLYAVIVLVRTL